MKKSLLFCLLMILIINFNFINAEIVKGNSSGEIQTTYGLRSPIKGWINISISKEANSSVLNTFFNSNSGKDMNIQELIDLNELNYNCYPFDCSENLTTRGDASSKAVTINRGENKLLGIKINAAAPVNSINSIEFDISSNGENSCYSKPLKIDILNDGIFEYSSEGLSDELCTIQNPYGCFNSSIAVNYTSLDGEKSYCENIQLPPYRSYLVGANISTNSSDFSKEIKITIEAGGCSNYCYANINNNQIKCNVTLECELTSFTNATVCIEPQVDTPYYIRYERLNTCGYLINQGYNPNDFEIFTYPIKYKAVGKFSFNKSITNSPTTDGMKDLADLIGYHLEGRYSGNESGINCSNNGCVVPIRFVSGLDNQKITISNIKLGYVEGGISANATLVGELVSSPPVITFKALSKLYLDEMNIPTPNSEGIYRFSIKYNGNELFKTNITVSNVMNIADIIPKEGFALVNNNFFVVFDSPMNQTVDYYWKFGNSTPIITKNPSVNYKFDSTGQKSLTVTLVTNKGNSSKTIPIEVYPPTEGFNMTLKKYKESLANFTSQLNSQNISALLRNEINGANKAIDLDAIKEELNSKEELFYGYLDSEESKKLLIMNDLLGMKIPSKLIVTHNIKTAPFLQNSNLADFAALEEFGAGTLESEDPDFSKKLNSWFGNSLNVSFSSKAYTLIYSNGESKFLFSDMNFNINPKIELPLIYFIVKAYNIADKIKIGNSELKSTTTKDNGALNIEFKDLVPNQNSFIQLLYPVEVDITNVPVYISPELSEVGSVIGVNTGDCNNNGKCDNSENYKSCPGDCKPWRIAITLIIILLVFAIIVYILMQEWYKRYYESYLFTNKAQLFNLINFMYNSSNQGTIKSEIFSKLKNKGWKGEQIEYAWKKFKGERVGMWEIPVFKWAENRQVKKELIKRNPNFSKNPI